MIWLLTLIFYGHFHKWKVLDKGTFRITDGYTTSGETVKTGVRYTCQCEKCGAIRGFDV